MSMPAHMKGLLKTLDVYNIRFLTGFPLDR